MDIPRISKAVRRITLLRKDAAGAISPVTLYQRGRKKKKGTRAFTVIERAARRIVDAGREAGDSYLSQHKKSNRKRRDGWIRDLPSNFVRAGDKGRKALRLNRVFS